MQYDLCIYLFEFMNVRTTVNIVNRYIYKYDLIKL